MANKVRWHKSCFALFNSTKLKRAEKRRTKLEDYVKGGKFTHSNVSVAQKKLFPPVLYATSVMAKHFSVSTLGLDDQLQECATLLNKERLLAKLSGGDLIALEAKYHTVENSYI